MFELKSLRKNLISLGCSLILLPTIAFSDGSMRIDVEVYDGPLSRSLELQAVELQGTMDVTRASLITLARSYHISQCSLGCFGTSYSQKSKDAQTSTDGKDKAVIDRNCRSENVGNFTGFDPILSKKSDVLSALKIYPQHLRDQLEIAIPLTAKSYYQWSSFPPEKITETILDVKKEQSLRQVCPILADIQANMIDVLHALQSGQYPDSDAQTDFANAFDQPIDKVELRRTLIRPAVLAATHLREGAERWATSHLSTLSKSTRARIDIARAAIFAAELGNELSARADAVNRQLDGHNLTHLFPTSFYLRDSESTDYVNLVEWMRASPIDKAEGLTRQDRTRVIERLVADANWSKINTAFAQGRGDVNMVFIKDDIGNWNLKNYDNNPEELLKTYRDVGTTLMTTAAQLATGGTSLSALANGLSNLQQTFQTAEGIMLGTAQGHAAADEAVSRIEARTRNELKRLYEGFKSQQAKRIAAKATKTAELEEAETNLQEKETKYEEEIAPNIAQNQQAVDTLEREKQDLIAQRSDIEGQDLSAEEKQEKLDEVNGKLVETQGLLDQAIQNRATYEKNIAPDLKALEMARTKQAALTHEIAVIDKDTKNSKDVFLKLSRQLLEQHDRYLDDIRASMVSQLTQ